ncbi:MAG: DUF3276 family protein, partial [Flavobacterium sp.]
GYDRHKMFIYKEDFNKFLVALTETVDYVKTELMPDFDFDAFNHDDNEEGREYSSEPSAMVAMVAETSEVSEIVDSTPIVAADDDSGMDAWKI